MRARQERQIMQSYLRCSGRRPRQRIERREMKGRAAEGPGWRGEARVHSADPQISCAVRPAIAGVFSGGGGRKIEGSCKSESK